MPSDQTWARYSSIATVLSGISTVITSFGKPVLSFVFIALIVLTVLLLIVTVVFIVRSRKITLKDVINGLGKNPAPYTANFEIIDYKTVITIEDKTGQNNVIEQMATVKCKKNASNKFYFRFAPDKHYSDFIFSSGRIISQNRRNNGIDVIVEFDRPCILRETKDIKITAKMKGLLDEPEEFWSVNRYYKNIGSNTLQITFPKNIPIITYHATVTTDERHLAYEPASSPIQKQVVENRTILNIETNILKINQKLTLHWTW